MKMLLRNNLTMEFFILEIPDEAVYHGEKDVDVLWTDKSGKRFPEEFRENLRADNQKRAAAVYKKEISETAMDYLRSTDWYILREFETSVPTPEDVKTRRADARLVLGS